MPAQLQYANYTFLYNAFVHLGYTIGPVLENNRHFFYFKSQFPGGYCYRVNFSSVGILIPDL